MIGAKIEEERETVTWVNNNGVSTSLQSMPIYQDFLDVFTMAAFNSSGRLV